MHIVIAEYESLADAQRAVRSLESQLSIQGVVIREQAAHKWKRRDLRRDRRLDRDGDHAANYVVSMSGTPEGIERARALLQGRASSEVTAGGRGES